MPRWVDTCCNPKELRSETAQDGTLLLQASFITMICPSLRFNASSHTGEAYSLQSEGPQIRDCTGSSPLSARNVLRSALFFNLLQNLDHAPLGRSLLHSKGSQIRGCTGSFPLPASIIHRYDISFTSVSKLQAIMGSLLAAI